ncbi:hypothetical protein HanHA89_Chr02g0042531 [Helianthus annuus]|nr:hypothetical protein HanHA89_Chr02g0042531 [Helianthus annuus]
MSDSLLDDDDGDGDGDDDDDDDDNDNDDDVELSTTKQEHRELVENLSHMSDSVCISVPL